MTTIKSNKAVVTAPTEGGAEVGAIASAPKGFRLSVQQMLQGIQTVLPQGSNLASASGAVSQAAMVSQMQAVLQAYQTVSDEEVQLKESRASFSAQLPTFHQQYSTLKNLLVGFFGAGSPQLAKFGLKPKGKSRTLTPEQLVARKAASAETRKLRGTLGSRQKQAVVFKGTVEVSATPQSASPSEQDAPPPTPSGTPPGK